MVKNNTSYLCDDLCRKMKQKRDWTAAIAGRYIVHNIIVRRYDSKRLSALFGIVWVAVSGPVTAHLVL